MVLVLETVEISQGIGVKTATTIVSILRSLWPWMRVSCLWVLSVCVFVFAFVEIDVRENAFRFRDDFVSRMGGVLSSVRFTKLVPTRFVFCGLAANSGEVDHG